MDCFNLFLDFEIESNLCLFKSGGCFNLLLYFEIKSKLSLFESGDFGGAQCDLLFNSFDQTIYFDVVNVLRVTPYVNLSALLSTISHDPELKSQKGIPTRLCKSFKRRCIRVVS